MKTHIFQQGEIIFRQGDPAETMYDIVRGSVGIYAFYGTSEEKQLSVLKDAEPFGEMGLIEQCPRSATAVAMENDTQLQEISADEFSDYFREKPVQVFLIMQQLSRRLRETTQNYVEACRTVSNVLDVQKTGGKKSSWLREKLDTFAKIYHSSLRV